MVQNKFFSQILIGYFSLLLVGCGGGSGGKSLEKEGGIELILPTYEHVDGAVITVVENPPEVPESLILSGMVYDVEVPESTSFPVEISIPASQEVIDAALDQQILLGRHNGEFWDLFSAEIVDGKVVASVDHFSPVAVFFRPYDELARDEAFYAGLQVKTPTVKWLSVEGDQIYAELNLMGSTIAIDSREEQSEAYPAVAVKGIVLNFSTPISITSGTANPREEYYREFSVDEQLYLDFEEIGHEAQTAFKFKIGPSSFFESAQYLANLGEFSTASFAGWLMKARPLFGEDLLPGKLTEGTANSEFLPLGVADTYLKMRQGLADLLQGEHKTMFLARTEETPLLLPYDKGWNEVYSNPLGFANSNYLALFGVEHPLIGLSDNSGWVRVVTYEWGHYAAHMLLGDEWTKTVATGSHEGWKEADSRELAWAEDLATFIGQWAVEERLNGLPSVSGAMAGKTSQNDNSHLSQFPESSELDNSTVAYWPNNKEMDVPSVEIVSATILSRLSQETSFTDVITLIIDTKPRTLIEFITNWFEKYGSSSEQAHILQEICVKEELTWQVSGKVIDQSSGTALEGVDVIISVEEGDLSIPSVSTNSEGVFTTVAPPGVVKLSFDQGGYGGHVSYVAIDTNRNTKSGRFDNDHLIVTSQGITEVNYNQATIEIRNSKAFGLAKETCSDYEVYLDGSCQNYYPPEAPSQVQLDFAMSEEVICPLIKPEGSGTRYDLPVGTDYSGEYTACRYYNSEDNSFLASQVHYDQGERIGVEIYFTPEGNIRNYVYDTGEAGSFLSVWINIDRFVTQLYYIKEAENMYLSMYFSPDLAWSYEYSLGAYGEDNTVSASFQDTSVTGLMLYGPGRNLEKDMRFENGMMTQCTLRDGNTNLGSCL